MAQSILAVGEFLGAIPSRFTYARDPDDAHYVNLALAARANLIISRDKDLLSLTDPANSEGAALLKTFSDFRVLDPVQFLRELSFVGDE